MREDVGFGPVVAPKEEQKEEKEEEEQQQIGPRGETFGGCFVIWVGGEGEGGRYQGRQLGARLVSHPCSQLLA